MAIEILRLTFLMLSKYIQDMSSDQDRSLFFPSFISFKPGPLEAYTRPLYANSMEGETEGKNREKENAGLLPWHVTARQASQFVRTR